MDLTKLSRLVSYALRHEPWIYELEIDNEGWVYIEDLIHALRLRSKEWQNLNESDLQQMISTSDKRRFEISNGKMRALYGHSLRGKLLKISSEPPSILFHGTSSIVVDDIKHQGLKPMSRQYVHLSIDKITALQVAKRKPGYPKILEICASEAHQKGIKFYIGNERVWLTDYLPPEFIKVCPDLRLVT
ncbi:MAG: RNA 2'-phosphotransferase [Nitrososphaerales archaeon]